MFVDGRLRPAGLRADRAVVEPFAHIHPGDVERWRDRWDQLGIL
jgi:hypothetical protein